jgi:hypothetical protein
VLAAMTLALGACRDSGLPDRNLPISEAENRPFRYAVYDAAAPAVAAQSVIQADSARWMIAGGAEPIRAALMTPVAAEGGAQVFAPAWERAPYDRLWIQVGDGMYKPLQRLH